jgi:hypothetical protein
MHEAKSYKTAGAFRAALENRLQMRARDEKTDLQRLRREVAFDRFLTRIFLRGPKVDYPWLLKGGYAMELRIQFARATKDLDLTLRDGTGLSKVPKERGEEVRAMLQEAVRARLDDFFEFLIGEAREDLDGAPEGGSRYPIQAQMDGRDFARFPVDVGIGDEVIEPLDVVTGKEAWIRRHRAAFVSDHFGGTAIRGEAARIYAAAWRANEYKNEGPDRYGAINPWRKSRTGEGRGRNPCDVHETRNT